MLIAPLLLLLAAEPQVQAAPPDGAAPARISAEAKGDLLRVAGILTQETPFSIQKDPRSGIYSSASAARSPGDDESGAKSEALLPRLQKLADLDRSGSVSTSEARALRRTVETGLMAAHVLSREAVSLEQLCHEISVRPEDAASVWELYDNVRAGLRDVGSVRMPTFDLPAPGQGPGFAR